MNQLTEAQKNAMTMIIKRPFDADKAVKFVNAVSHEGLTSIVFYFGNTFQEVSPEFRDELYALVHSANSLGLPELSDLTQASSFILGGRL